MVTKRKTTSKTLKDDISAIASKAVIDSKAIELLATVVKGGRGKLFSLGYDRQGKLVKGSAPIQVRLAATKLLLEYAVGKPRPIEPVPSKLPVPIKLAQSKSTPELVIEVLERLERMRRVVNAEPEASSDEPIEEDAVEVVSLQLTEGAAPARITRP